MLYLMNGLDYLPMDGDIFVNDKYFRALNENQINPDRFNAQPFTDDILNFALKKEHPYWDVIRTNNSYFYISERFKELLTKYTLSPHQYHKATIKKGDESRTYYLIHLLYTIENPEDIEYSKSTFIIATPHHKRISNTYYGYFRFKSYEEAQKIYNIILNPSIIDEIIEPDEEFEWLKPYWIRDIAAYYEKEEPLGICFLNLALKKCDLFKIPFLQTNFMLSERLYKVLIEHNISGLSFEQATWIKFSE